MARRILEAACGLRGRPRSHLQSEMNKKILLSRMPQEGMVKQDENNMLLVYQKPDLKPTIVEDERQQGEGRNKWPV